MDFRYRYIEFLTSRGQWRVNQPPTVATWTSRHLESEREQRNPGWSWSAHTPIKRISDHRDSISCHPLCCTNDLIDLKGRCCPKIVVSIPRGLFTSGKNYIDRPLKIVHHWYLKYLLTQTFFLVIAQGRFHSKWSTISFQKIRRKKNINWNLFSHFDAI